MITTAFNFSPFGSASSIASESPVKMLLVDDEPGILSSLTELLKDRDYVLTCATDGREAIKHLSHEPFDLVILDLHLPDISGHDIMDFMNIKKTDASVIVTSGATGVEAVIGALKRGAYDYLRKPYSRDELIKAVDNAMQQRRLKAENQRIVARLESSEKVYRFLVDCSPDMIYTLDHEGRFTFVNDRTQQLLGFSRDQLIGQHYSVLVHEEDMERANYVFNEGRGDSRLSCNVELQLRSRHADSGTRVFSHELMIIPFDANDKSSELDPKRRALLGTYGIARDITERKRADKLIAYQAYHDILTKLPNRILFKDRLGMALLQAERNESCLAVMFLDLDRFKLVNDTLGHGIGDELLQQVAMRLKACLRRCDTLTRLGGDEFTTILPELSGRQDASLIAEKFIACLRLPFQLAGQSVHISASIGIATYPSDGTLIEELLGNADVAMYHVKAKGKNDYAFFEHAMLDMPPQKMAT